jgi:hypothetical protein
VDETRMPARAMGTIMLSNLVMGVTVFLPVLLVGNMVIGAFPGLPVLERGLAYQAADFLMAYLGFGGPVAVGVVAHSIAAGFLVMVLPVRRIQMAVLLLAPLVPFTPIFLGLKGASLFCDFYPATTIATLAYAFATTAFLSRRAVPGLARAASVSEQV